MKLTVEVRQLETPKQPVPLLWRCKRCAGIVAMERRMTEFPMPIYSVFCVKSGEPSAGECHKLTRRYDADLIHFFPCDHEGNALPEAKPIPQHIWRRKDGTGYAIFRRTDSVLSSIIPEIFIRNDEIVAGCPFDHIEGQGLYEPAGACEIVIRQTPE